ncbi:MAG TPA: FG-GAP-like repeat-containing protein [Agromyces sp.]|nr:FG-GAP-like repeat-containing protein [Agromyces sp.]
MVPTRRPFRLLAAKRGLAALAAALVLSALTVLPAPPAHAADPASITGVVLDAAGAPAGSVYIEAYAPGGSGSRGTYVAQGRAASDGTFRIDGLEAGREYRLFLNWSACCSRVAPSHAGFFTDDPVDTMTQHPEGAALFATGSSGLSGVVLRLEPARAMSGRVVAPDGTPLAGVQVYVLTATEYNDIARREGMVPSTHSYSDENGAFRVSDLEYIGDEIDGHVVRVDAPGKYPGYVAADPSMGLVPIDRAHLFPPAAEEVAGLEVVLPQVELPADQIILGERIAPYKGGSPGGSPGQILVVGDGTLSVFSMEDGVLTRPEGVRLGFEDEQVYAPGNWGGLDWHPDGNSWVPRNDIISVDTRGDMHLYEGDGYGYLREPKRIGWGWSGYRVIPSGDLNRDGTPDLLAIDRDGYLKLYRGDGTGGFLSPYPKVGNGWNGFDLYSAGDLTGDGRADILSVDPRGDLWMYAGNGDGTFQMRKKVGNGWGTYTLAAGADVDGYVSGSTYGNLGSDIVGRDDATGDLYLYSGRGDGTFATKRLIATGW